MRTFESAASMACILAEATSEHECIYGDYPSAILFQGIEDMLARTRDLCEDVGLRELVRERVFERIVSHGGNTYVDRLISMTETVGRNIESSRKQ